MLDVLSQQVGQSSTLEQILERREPHGRQVGGLCRRPIPASLAV